MINPNLIFKVIFIYKKTTIIKNLTQVPNQGDKVRFNNMIFTVETVSWDINSYIPEDTGYQAAIGIELKKIGDV